MLNTNLFLTANDNHTSARIKIKNGAIVFEWPERFFNRKLIQTILQFSNTVLAKNYPLGLPIRFSFENTIQFSDKLTYVLFECICYQLIQSGHPVYTNIRPKYSINTHGYRSSPLWLLTTGKLSHIEKFTGKFNHEYYKLHFRTVLESQAKESVLSTLMDDIAIFQKPFDIKPEEREKITEVLIELIGNAKEHATGDCLIDFDISSKYFKRGVDGKNYRGINIVILNFAEELLGTSIQTKLCQGTGLSDRHQKVIQAYNLHKRYFGERYLEEDFFNIAAFQHKISGRMENYSTGGTGLTKLILSLEEDSDAYDCYVISGHRKLLFEKEYMKYNEDQWIGFNCTNDFLGAPPNLDLIQKAPFFFPGTAYNLNFVMEVV